MIHNKKQFTLLTSLVLASSLFAGGSVITNKSTGINSITEFDAKVLFLKKKSSFADGTPVVVGDQTIDSAPYKEFTKSVIGKKPKKLKVYWSKRVFAGKGTPPKEIGDDAAMLEWVAKTPNSLGYVTTPNDSVKVLLGY